MKPSFRWMDLLPAVPALLAGALPLVPGLGAFAFHIFSLIVVMALVVILILCLVGVVRKQVVLFTSHGWYIAQLVLRTAFVAAWALFVVPPTADALRYLAPAVTPLVFGIAWVMVATIFVLQVFPRKRVSIVTNVAFAVGLIGICALGLQSYATPAGVVELAWPFERDGVVFQGGRGVLVNHHYSVSSQRDALDLVTLNDDDVVGGPSMREFDCFGVPVLAPASGRVVEAVDGLRDITSFAQIDQKNPAGNHVFIQIAEGRYLLLAHLQDGSVNVETGDEVTCGDVIGRCGNSGITTMPHLHIQMGSGTDILDPNGTTLPIKFTKLTNGDRLRRGSRLEYARFECP